MQFRDLRKQYEHNKSAIDDGIKNVIESADFISGQAVYELEKQLAEYVGVKHCISCANGTDALQLSLLAWGTGKNDVVFVPDFTFFSSGEAVSAVGAIPVFVDVNMDTYNISAKSLEKMILKVISQGTGTPKAIIAVDLFGQPADYIKIREIADKYGLFLLEDGAQGFGGKILSKKACSFGDISTTSFFPAKPFGCYGDGGAIFTDSDEWAALLRSYKVHGKGESKYDNVRIGMNSRLDTLQASILLAKFPVFIKEELDAAQEIALFYSSRLKDMVIVPAVLQDYFSAWAQFTIRVGNRQQRDGLKKYLSDSGIPVMIYYQKPMHRQRAFDMDLYHDDDYPNTNTSCETVLSLPCHPYLNRWEIQFVVDKICEFMKGSQDV